MPLLIWFSWSAAAIVVVILAILIIVVKMAADYLALPGHFEVSRGLVGQIGTAKTECTPHQRGKVYVAGAYWDAISEYGVAHAGKDIQVIEVREKFLVVKPVDLVGLGPKAPADGQSPG